jgi:hypothetical protein
VCPGEPGESGGPLIEKNLDEFAHGVEAFAEFYDARKMSGWFNVTEAIVDFRTLV